MASHRIMCTLVIHTEMFKLDNVIGGHSGGKLKGNSDSLSVLVLYYSFVL